MTITYEQFTQKLLKQKLLSIKHDRIVPNAQTKRGLEREDNSTILDQLTSFIEIEYSLIEKLYLVLNNTTSQPKCLFCGKNVGFHTSGDKKGQLKNYCNSKCSNRCPIRNAKTEEVCLQRYGVPRVQQTEELKQKRTNTMIERYGVAVPMQSEQLRNKITQTNMEKYGVAFPLENEVVYKKTKQSNIDNHDGVFSTKHQLVKEKAKGTFEKRYGATHPSRIGLDPTTVEKITNKDWLFNQHHILKKSHMEIAEELHLTNTTISRWFRNFNIPVQRFPSSLGEKQVCAFVQSLIPNDTIISGTRDVIPPSELDVYIPSHNFAIEYNGIYRHSADSGKEKTYHLNKTNHCKKRGIDLFHFYDVEWENSQNTVKSTIQKHLKLCHKVFSEYLSLKICDSDAAESFRVTNCLEDFDFKLCYGLFLGSDIKCAIYLKNDTVKYIEQNFTEVVGGFQTLFEFVRTKHDHAEWFHVTNLRFPEDLSEYNFVPRLMLDPQKDVFTTNSKMIEVWNCGYLIWSYRDN